MSANPFFMASNLLSKEILESVKQYTENLKKPVELVLHKGQHPKRQELYDFLFGLSEVSDRVEFKEEELHSLRSPITFELKSNGRSSGILFSGIEEGQHKKDSYTYQQLCSFCYWSVLK